jgi:hypothetical protein
MVKADGDERKIRKRGRKDLVYSRKTSCWLREFQVSRSGDKEQTHESYSEKFQSDYRTNSATRTERKR